MFEASDRFGGVLQTVRRDDFLIEKSADNFITNVPWALDLCRRLKIEPDLLHTNAAHRQAKVVFQGRLHDVPAGFLLMAPTQLWSVLTTPLLSVSAKLRMLAEVFVPRARGQDDESLASFVRRRLGNEVFERLVQPLVGGIYTADPEQLSLAATLPRFLDMEQKYGSLLMAAARGGAVSDAPGNTRTSGARYSMFVAPREGMSGLVQALIDQLPPESLRLGAPVDRIARAADGSWQVTLAASSETAESATGASETIAADAVIVATPAYRTAEMLSDVDGELAGLLRKIPYAGTTIVVAAYHRDQFGVPVDCFGFVVPACERRRILAASFSSVKYPGRAPEGSVLVRTFVGGACQSELAELDDEAVRRLVNEELGQLLKISGAPIFEQIVRWPRAMPQYHVGHLDLVAEIERRAAQHDGLALAGNAYRGVGVPQCVKSGEAAAEAIMKTSPAPVGR